MSYPGSQANSLAWQDATHRSNFAEPLLDQSRVAADANRAVDDITKVEVHAEPTPADRLDALDIRIWPIRQGQEHHPDREARARGLDRIDRPPGAAGWWLRSSGPSRRQARTAGAGERVERYRRP